MRNEWVCELSVAEILEAAKEKLKWHKDRLDFWTETREKTEAQIKNSGLTIEKSVAAGYSTTGRPPSVSIDSAMLADLNECNTKIAEHKNKEFGYASWVQFLSSCRPKDRYMLNPEDWRYFYSHEHAPVVSEKFSSE